MLKKKQLFLTRAITPPQMQAMEQAWSTLEELGAVDQSGRLTALGRHMVRKLSNFQTNLIITW